MDWFNPWPRDALVAVSNFFLSKYDMVCTPETKQQIIETMGIVHDDVAVTCVEYYQRLDTLFLILDYELPKIIQRL